jgi:hypothetical protein
MDMYRFDDLARWLSAPGSRRLVLAALLGGTLSALPPASSSAKKGKGKKRKRKTRGGSPPPSPPAGVCQGVPNDSPCAGDGKCLNGVCNPPPECRTKADGLCVGAEECCNGFNCLTAVPCGTGAAGIPCQVTTDCNAGLVCVGFRCVAP